MGRVSKFAWSAIPLTVLILVFSSAPVGAQQQGQTSATPTSSQSQHDDQAKRDAARLSELLDQHPDAEKQLKANPYLINDPNFLSTQPALKAFLDAHPDVKSQLEQSPVDFVRRENGSQDTKAATEPVGTTGAAKNRELGRMDEFLDEHRDVEQQLALNPSLISDQNYLAQHRELAALLSAHPDIRLELAANPGYFLQHENQAAAAPASEPAPTASNGTNTGVAAQPDREREIGEMDQFLDEHRDLKQDLQQRPVLINDANYLAQHPELGLFLEAHPGIRQDFSERPEAFVTAVNVQPPASSSAATTNIERPKPPAVIENPNRDLENREATRMAQFLDDHPNIRRDLGKNPWLVNQSKYLKHHKELERFLSEYPQIREKLADNPTYFEPRQREAETVGEASTGTLRPFHTQFNSIDLELVNRFLEKHKKTAKELESDPALVTSQHYLDHNKDLRQFFDVHPHILEEFRQSPRNFMDQENQLRAELR